MYFRKHYRVNDHASGPLSNPCVIFNPRQQYLTQQHYNHTIPLSSYDFHHRALVILPSIDQSLEVHYPYFIKYYNSPIGGEGFVQGLETKFLD